MKNILIALTFGLIIFFSLTMIKSCSNIDYVSKEEFETAHQFLNKRVDTIIINQNVMQYKIDSIMKQLKKLENNQQIIKYRLDTLQAGQILIYSEITKQPKQQANKNFFDYAIEFLNQ